MSTCTLEVSVSPPGADEAEVDVEHSKDEPDKPQPHNPTSWSRRLSSRFAVVLVACLVGLVLVTAGSVATWRAVKNPTGTAVNDASDSLTLAFVQEDGKGCRDAAIFYTLATSIELCQAKCASLSRCAGFAYHKEKQSCNILKGQCLTTVTSQVHVLGFKVISNNTFGGLAARSVEAASFCSLSCPLPWLGDGSCDPSCNTDECGFDGNDCPQTAIQNVDDHSDSKANVTIMMQVRLERDTTQTGNPADKSALDKAFEDFPAGCDPVLCKPRWVGDKECDTRCNTFSCGFDGGDCDGEENEECSPGCFISWIGDGDCDLECNVPKCDNDDYDCSYEDDDAEDDDDDDEFSDSNCFEFPVIDVDEETGEATYKWEVRGDCECHSSCASCLDESTDDSRHTLCIDCKEGYEHIPVWADGTGYCRPESDRKPGCYASPDDDEPVEDCTCHFSCSACGYRGKNSFESCIDCSDENYILKALNPDGTGMCTPEKPDPETEIFCKGGGVSVYYDDERPGVDAYVACGAFGGDELWAVPRPESKLCVKDFRDCICLAGMKQRFEDNNPKTGRGRCVYCSDEDSECVAQGYHYVDDDSYHDVMRMDTLAGGSQCKGGMMKSLKKPSAAECGLACISANVEDEDEDEDEDDDDVQQCAGYNYNASNGMCHLLSMCEQVKGTSSGVVSGKVVYWTLE